VPEVVQSGEEQPSVAPRWREVWQMPALIAAAALLGTGLVATVVWAPKPDMSVGLMEAQRQMDGHEYAQALQTLNEQVLPSLAKGLTPDQRRQFHILRARCLYQGQKDLNIDRPENNRAIVSEYGEAERLNATLEPRDSAFLASTLLSLGDIELAARRAQALPDESRESRNDLLKRAIDLSIRAPHPDFPRALDMVTFLTADPRTGVEDRAWLLGRQARVLLAQGYAGEAVSKIVHTLPRLDGASQPILGEIHYELARAYDAQNDVEEAVKELERAVGLLDAGSPLIPSIMLLQGEIYHKKPALGSARDRYSAIIAKFPSSDEFAAALLGMGEVDAEAARGPEAGVGETNDQGADTGGAIGRSLDHYTRLVDLLRSGANVQSVSRERVGDSLLARFREQFEGRRPDFRKALQFASLGEQLFGIDGAPSEIILALAQVHRKLAEELLSAAGGVGVISLADADPATQREARDHFIRAGEFFRAHAARVVQVSTTQYGDSLWAAADCFDRAGDTDACISAFQQFANDFPSDSRHAEATFRLAQSYQSRGDLDLAAGLYRDLIDNRTLREQAGPFADASYVPLAQTLLADADPANDNDAENLLLAVVNGAVGGTHAPAFKDALRELGQRYYQTQRYERAIERFEEYLQRTAGEGPAANAAEDVGPPSAAPAEDPVAESIRYKLADSYRLSAVAIGSALAGGAMPDGDRRELEKTRSARLTAAGELYEQARRGLEAKKHRSTIEDLYLRNTYFYLGDCAFDLKDYAGAIAHYDAARERYPKEPASLVAMTQIVSALLAQGEVKKAEIANRRAMLFYQSLPPAAWEDPNLPISQKDWQHWLDAQADLANASKKSTIGSAEPE
jgi:tetratricopeptide (TPR) repeat protein